MRIIFSIIMLLYASFACAQDWEAGSITRQAWLDQGGYHVEINGVRYLFLNDAIVEVSGVNYSLPDRLLSISKNSRVVFKHQGFVVSSIKILIRN